MKGRVETGAPRLAALDRGRDNNLNLVRAVAATGVLASHAWPIAGGGASIDPLEASIGFSLGALCVYVFFAVSGYLIVGSWARRPRIGRFLAARSLRLLPGLVVSLLAVALVLGPATTTRPLWDYLTDPEVPAFLLRNATLAFPVYTLPGVFEGNPYPKVEGSIWTLIHEALCYGLVLLLGLAGATGRRLGPVLVAGALVWLAAPATGLVVGRLAALHDLVLPFGLGMAAYAWRDRLPLSGPLAALGLTAALCLGLAMPGGAVARVALVAALGYATLWAAYVPSGAVRAYNRVGDYSYGIYIYAFPLQGLAVWAWGPQTPLANIALAAPMTLVAAIASWHLIEAPALRLLRPGGLSARTAQRGAR